MSRYAVVLLMLLGSVNGYAIELIANGGCEAGTLVGWSSTNLTRPGSCGSADNAQDWVVSDSGVATNCLNPGAPPEGVFAAYNMFDAGTSTPLSYRLWQQVTLPENVTNATLRWIESINWGIGGTAPRVFSVEVLDSTATTTVATIAATEYGPVSTGSTGWVVHSEDITQILAPLSGRVVNLQFAVYVPEAWTGAAGMGLDGISLDVTASSQVQAVPTLSHWGALVLISLVALIAFARSGRRGG